MIPSEQDKLESVLDVSHQQMEQYQDQPAHAEKIAYQQRLLQEDVVHIRADISQVSTEMENAWGEYIHLESDVDWLRSALQAQMNRTDISQQQEKAELRKELWRMEDVLAGLSSSKANYQVTLSSVTNPGEGAAGPANVTPTHTHWDPHSAVPSGCGSPSAGEMRQQQHQQQQHSPHLSPTSPTPRPGQQPLLHPSAPITTRLIWGEEDAPPRPPLPQLYSPDEHPPAVPPLPRETNVIRHTSVRGLKRQSDERKRDRETGQFTNGDGRQQQQLRGKMSADEQLERMKRHQKALVRQRKRTLSHGDARTHASSSRAASSSSSSSTREQEFDLQLLERAVQGEEAQGGEDEVRRRRRREEEEEEEEVEVWEPECRSVQGEERPPEEHKERPRSRSDEWLTFRSSEPPASAATPHQLEPLEYDLDLSKELSTPQKVLIPERYIDSEPEEPLSPQEVEERYRKNLVPSLPMDKKTEVGGLGGLGGLDSALQEQERIITMSYALASEASLKSKQVTARAVSRQ
ncbi:hypothetical protein CRUP_017765 [Coryphaenoides rupestris]|nr:hypothetical protein CRUP_017765 [Coryphaenoides rupestris]